MVVASNMKIKTLLLVLLCSALCNAAEAVDKDGPAFELDFNTTTLAQWPEVLKQYHGKILVVDMWATWCASCLERFPHMVEMAHKYKDFDVAIISLLLEDPEEPEAIENAKRFLIKQQADFAHYFMDENLMRSFDQLDLLGIPAVFVYDHTGQRTHKLTGDNPNKQFSEKDIYDAVNALIIAREQAKNKHES